WAMLAREFEDAESVFVRLKPGLRRSAASLYYVNILQRQSRFTEALNLLKEINASILSKAGSVSPVNHWNLIRRYGELSFLRATSNVYVKARQPSDPAGVIFIAPRNIDQLRKYPLVVLMELKRMGWAVVPLVEGLLPREMTGRSEIDLLHGCITIECEF